MSCNPDEDLACGDDHKVQHLIGSSSAPFRIVIVLSVRLVADAIASGVLRLGVAQSFQCDSNIEARLAIAKSRKMPQSMFLRVFLSDKFTKLTRIPLSLIDLREVP
ncbi:hypothetical protein C0081_20455 [Cohaesibacter celericrescens]|uniref:Uncharacterized protein n=1 Tax=Cohaesibacter celericrescens TaxID=2067669 RepID=A0A2N5XKZ1_9HYPH|nr:hypothetical protein C0081_20455 [Cohaesibacter celericrescens]